MLLPLLHPSSKSNLLCLKQCVHKLMTQQQCFLSPSSSPSSSIYLQSLQQQHFPTNSWRKRSRHHHHYYCRLLNLNHHITFHYINISSTNNLYHHRYFHLSSSSTGGADNVAATEHNNGSITEGNLCHDFVNDSQSRELNSSLSDARQHQRKVEPDRNKDDDEEEDLKEQVWSVGPALLPTFNVGAYANESENVKKLVQLGVDLSQWEPKYGAIPILYKSNFKKTMQPIISFLQDAGVDGQGLSRILTQNPFIFNEDVRNLEKRLEYLRVKRFSEEIILNAIVKNPFWLMFSVPRIDRRLGFFQTHFSLTGDQVRKLVKTGSSGPKLITYHLGHVKDVTFTIKEEMGFSSEEIVKLLLTRPRIWKEYPFSLRGRFNYLHNEEKFSHEVIAQHPLVLLCRERRLRDRIGFLRELGRAQFDPELPNFISFERLCLGDDAEFVTTVAGASVEQFNNFLKTL